MAVVVTTIEAVIVIDQFGQLLLTLIVSFELNWLRLRFFSLSEELTVIIVVILPVLIEKGLRPWLADSALEALVDPEIVAVADWNALLHPNIIVTIGLRWFKM